jgi:hypothetical protein
VVRTVLSLLLSDLVQDRMSQTKLWGTYSTGIMHWDRLFVEVYTVYLSFLQQMNNLRKALWRVWISLEGKLGTHMVTWLQQRVHARNRSTTKSMLITAQRVGQVEVAWSVSGTATNTGSSRPSPTCWSGVRLEAFEYISIWSRVHRPHQLSRFGQRDGEWSSRGVLPFPQLSDK